ncbi:MAG: diaminopimelate epimerase [Rhodospirillales bacterium]|nr:diaminopimelate epimerase [Rhodospirillales bacterium]
MAQAVPLPFRKMHGLGNDFVVIDARAGTPAITAAAAQRIADRRRGVGFDQLILIEPPRDPAATAFVRFLNADGSEAGACGNGSRCIGWLLAEELGRERLAIETLNGLLDCRREADGRMTVDLGPAKTEWREIPLSQAMDSLHLPLEFETLPQPAALSLGNPHATFFVDDAEAMDLERLGPILNRHSFFPERANIAAASLSAEDCLRVRVWERGAGMTPACGTGASAAAVNAARRGLTGRRVAVVLDGGVLTIQWHDDNRVEMTGPIATAFQGLLPPELLC